MTAAERTAVDLYAALVDWLAFRQGRESRLLDQNVNAWAEESEKTRRWRDRLDLVGYAYPTELVRFVVETVAEARGCSARDAWHEIRRNAGAYHCDYGGCPEIDRLTTSGSQAANRTQNRRKQT